LWPEEILSGAINGLNIACLWIKECHDRCFLIKKVELKVSVLLKSLFYLCQVYFTTFKATEIEVKHTYFERQKFTFLKIFSGQGYQGLLKPLFKLLRYKQIQLHLVFKTSWMQNVIWVKIFYLCQDNHLGCGSWKLNCCKMKIKILLIKSFIKYKDIFNSCLEMKFGLNFPTFLSKI